MASPRSGRAASASTVSLSVQFATDEAVPTRAQVRRWVASALRMANEDSAELVVRFVDEAEARTLNRDYRGKDYATNVLTFAYGEGHPQGDIVICPNVVAREANEQGKPISDHMAHMVVHGTLHAAGFDHEDPADATVMEQLERDVLVRFAIADPYLVERG